MSEGFSDFVRADLTERFNQRLWSEVTDRTGWFADVAQGDDDASVHGMWQPCLETGTGHVPCFGVWFRTQQECEDYIRTQILPIAGRMTSEAGRRMTEQPKWTDLFGIDPDFTEGQDADEWLNEQRGEA